jgi:hypothetical protein
MKEHRILPNTAQHTFSTIGTELGDAPFVDVSLWHGTKGIKHHPVKSVFKGKQPKIGKGKQLSLGLLLF